MKSSDSPPRKGPKPFIPAGYKIQKVHLDKLWHHVYYGEELLTVKRSYSQAKYIMLKHYRDNPQKELVPNVADRANLLNGADV